MSSARFVDRKQARWARLEELTRRAAHRGLGALRGDEIFELGGLYRAATSDLAVARRDMPADPVVEYLNGLVGRAHPFIYRDAGLSRGRILRFVRYGFPAEFRHAGPYIAVAFGVFVVAALISAALVLVQPSMADTLLSGEAAALRSVMEQHRLWMKSATENHSVAANYIMLNNIGVAFYAFASGMLAGAGTIAVMAINGMQIGAISAMVWQYGLSTPFWGFVAPHGAIELSVIFIAGGAGLMLGDSILRPGLQRRGDALRDAAYHAVTLLAGCVPLLVVAGTIESFFSPSDVPDGIKLGVGAFNLVWLYSYLLLSKPRSRAATYEFEDVLHTPAKAKR